MKKSTVITSLIGAVTLIVPLSLFAEHHEEEAAPPTLSEVWIVTAKSGMEDQFFAALVADKAMRAEGDDSRSWQVFNGMFGDDFGAVAFRACCFSWADQDAYEAEEVEKGFGDSWNENVHQYVDSYERHMETIDFENSHWPEGKGDGPYYGVTTWKAKMGAGPASGEALEAMSQIALEEGWANDDNNWLWHYRETGAPQMMLVSSFASYADMEPPEQSFFEFLTDKKGAEEAAAIFGDFSSGYTGSSYSIWQLNTELSADED